MPKKPPRNAFYFYMQDKMNEFRRSGHTVNSIADCVPLAHPLWKKEPDEVKKRYDAKAKAHKQKMRGAEGDGSRLDNQGRPITEYRDLAMEMDRRRKSDQAEIKSLLPSGDALLEKKFYMIHFEYLLFVEEEGGYFLPAEIGLSEYSLFHGIIRTYHSFILPGPVPIGYKSEAKSHSERRHKLPYDPGEEFDHWNDDYYGIWRRLCEFLDPNGEGRNFPPVYCLGDEFENSATEKCLDWLYEHARTYDSHLAFPKIRIFAVEDLLMGFYSKSRSSTITAVPSRHSCEQEMRMTNWDFEPETSCAFHEELECKFCALGFVKRWCYSISDSLSASKAFHFTLTEKHVPPKPVPKWSTLNSSASSSNFGGSGFLSRSDVSSGFESNSSSTRDFGAVDIRSSIGVDDDDFGGRRGDRSSYGARGCAVGPIGGTVGPLGGTVGPIVGTVRQSPPQPSLVQQSMGRGTALRGFGAAAAGYPTSIPGHGRGRGLGPSSVAPSPHSNPWGLSSAASSGPSKSGDHFSSLGGEREEEDFPSLGGGRRERKENSGNPGNFWTSMGRGRGQFSPSGAPAMGRGAKPTTVAPPPGFSATPYSFLSGGGADKVENLTHGVAQMDPNSESGIDWG